MNNVHYHFLIMSDRYKGQEGGTTVSSSSRAYALRMTAKPVVSYQRPMINLSV